MLTLDGIVAQLSAHHTYLGTYLGIFGLLLAGGLGVPIPEELPIVAAGVLSREGLAVWWLALPVCVVGVLSGDVILYWAGHHWGERILSWRPVRWVLSPEREQRLKVAYRRHAVKTIVIARHVIGLRAAAFLTAGIARVPFWRFLAIDFAAALLGLPLSFGLAYFFTDQVEAILADVHRVERWVMLGGLLVMLAVLAVVAHRWTRRAEAEIEAPPARAPERPAPLGHSTRRG
jgi:membrane protein DedA with SNARE-associated domain